jgi:uncharacterized membrane protein HdeD (DUF308 family)
MKYQYVDISEAVKTHSLWFLILGSLMLIMGTTAIVFPLFATLTLELFIGWVLVINGVAGIIHTFSIAKWKGFALSLLGALLSLGIGIIMLVYPLTGILSLTLLIAALFIVSGLFRMVLALQLRPLDHWGWILISGLLAFMLAILILLQWPEASGWILGLLVGIDLIFAGWTSIMLATASRCLT